MNTMNAKRRVCLAMGVLAMLAPAAHATSQPDHDANLAKAIADKVSARLGGLRDGFSHDEQPIFTPQEDIRSFKVRETLQFNGMKRIEPAPVKSGKTADMIKTGSVAPRTVRMVYPAFIQR